MPAEPMPAEPTLAKPTLAAPMLAESTLAAPMLVEPTAEPTGPPTEPTEPAEPAEPAEPVEPVNLAEAAISALVALCCDGPADVPSPYSAAIMVAYRKRQTDALDRPAGKARRPSDWMDNRPIVDVTGSSAEKVDAGDFI
jgi:hypothetical protein